MTTPAHCTRTWTSTPCYAEQSGIHACSALDSYHHVQHVCVCGNVEPPADVAATPDPRLDVVATIVGDVRSPESYSEMAQVILDALDAMRPDEPSIHTFVADEGWTEEQSFTPAPAGLDEVKQIHRWIEFGAKLATNAIAAVTTVEHGPDETADLRPSKEWRDALMQTERGWKDAAVRAEQAEARADLAEARLEHVRAALEMHGDLLADDPLSAALRDALRLPPSMLRVADFATEPDDTAPADAATGDGS